PRAFYRMNRENGSSRQDCETRVMVRSWRRFSSASSAPASQYSGLPYGVSPKIPISASAISPSAVVVVADCHPDSVGRRCDPTGVCAAQVDRSQDATRLRVELGHPRAVRTRHPDRAGAGGDDGNLVQGRDRPAIERDPLDHLEREGIDLEQRLYLATLIADP